MRNLISLRVLCLSAALLLLLGFVYTACAGWASAHRVTASDTLLSGQRAAGTLSDIVIENDRIVVVISDVRHILPYSPSGANIIDAGSRQERVDALMEIYTHFDNAWPRQAVYDQVEIIDGGEAGGRAVVRASGLDSKDPYLTVVTEYSLEAGADYLTLSTTVVNSGGSTYESFEVGDAFAWGDCERFVPGYGFAVVGNTASVWIAGTSGLVSYGYAGGGMTEIWGDHGSLWSHLNVTSTTLGPGDSVSYERYILVGGRDIASIATSIHEMTGAPAGSLSCSVRRQEDQIPLFDAHIDVYDSEDFPYLQMRTDTEGQASTTLPAGDWHLVAGKGGYESSDIWVSLGGGELRAVDFTIDEIKVVIPGIGDTLTVIQRPLLNIPSIVTPGDILTIECDAHPAATGWEAEIVRGQTSVPLEIVSSTYDASTLWWSLSAVVPEVPVHGLYDLRVAAAGGILDMTKHAVQVIPEFKDDYYFIHITDTHLPTHKYYYESGADTDTSEMVDLREVIADINIINPEFVLITGDFINEGELEDFLNRRYYSRAQRMLNEFEVPTFLIAGNHDIGGWDDTPPPDGTARRDWWRFFGWKRLDSPPAGAPWYTQNYSFDYGPVHYVALESYDNYDGWRYSIYGGDSFTSGQMQWLAADLAAASGSETQVLFYHYDFSRQINLSTLGVEMALWGHIHRDEGSLSGPPYNLATRCLCDGARSYRLVRVSGGTLQPTPTLSAGYDGNLLEVEFEPANDGTHSSVTAHITNNLSERFEHAVLRFLMPAACDSVDVNGGTLLQVENLGPYDTYCVSVDVLPVSSATVSVVLDSCSAAGDTSGVQALRLAPSRPNPFSVQTYLSFILPASGQARLAIYDIRGREVAVLADQVLGAGPHHRQWNGREGDSKPAASGIYFARLTFGGQERVQKMVLTR